MENFLNNERAVCGEVLLGDVKGAKKIHEAECLRRVGEGNIDIPEKLIIETGVINPQPFRMQL